MLNNDDLNIRFAIKDVIDFVQSDEGLNYLKISNKYADACMSLYGAHITSFRPHKATDILWMSPASNFEHGKPIRGGIPVCFPWFGPHKTDTDKPMHGFARLMDWQIAETAVLPGGETKIRLKLVSSEQTKTYWPYDFEAELTVIVGATLEVRLSVTNTSADTFEYSCALHTYYNLSSIGNITITGLQGARFHSQLYPGEFVQETSDIEITQAETRHYHNTQSTCILNDPGFDRKIKIAKSGSNITTVWNPGAETCAKIDDLPDDGYLTFVCVEAVNAFDDVIILPSGETHTTTAIISPE